MSYAVRMRARATGGLKALDVEAQEAVLDLIDYLADEAEQLPQRPMPIELEHLFGHADAHGSYVIELRVSYNPPARVVTIRSILSR